MQIIRGNVRDAIRLEVPDIHCKGRKIIAK